MKETRPSRMHGSEPVMRVAPNETLWGYIGIKEDPVHRWVMLAFGLLVVANALSYFAGSSSVRFLEASRSQPWGAVTSIGLYDAWDSTVALPLLALLWFLLNMRISSPERKRRSLLLVVGSTYAAVMANIIWMYSRTPFGFTEGVSGFEVATGGIMLVFVLTNLLGLRFRSVPSMLQLRNTDKAGMKRFLALIYCILAVMLVSSGFTLVEASGPSLNTEVHIVSLTVGIGLALFYELVSISKPIRAHWFSPS